MAITLSQNQGHRQATPRPPNGKAEPSQTVPNAVQFFHCSSKYPEAHMNDKSKAKQQGLKPNRPALNNFKIVSATICISATFKVALFTSSGMWLSLLDMRT